MIKHSSVHTHLYTAPTRNTRRVERNNNTAGAHISDKKKKNQRSIFPFDNLFRISFSFPPPYPTLPDRSRPASSRPFPVFPFLSLTLSCPYTPLARPFSRTKTKPRRYAARTPIMSFTETFFLSLSSPFVQKGYRTNDVWTRFVFFLCFSHVYIYIWIYLIFFFFWTQQLKFFITIRFCRRENSSIDF